MKSCLVGFALLCALLGARTAQATPSVCDAVAGNLVANCGFEAANDASAAYPAGWTTDAGYALEANYYNQVVTYDEHSGFNGLKFGNEDAQGPAGISQTLTTTAGATYAVTFWTYTGLTTDSNSFLESDLDGTSEVHLVGSTPTVGSYAQYGFSFVGTGSDTLAFLAQSNPSEWYLDDVVLTQTAAAPPGNSGTTAVPEPSSLLMLGAGTIGLVAARRPRRGH